MEIKGKKIIKKIFFFFFFNIYPCEDGLQKKKRKVDDLTGDEKMAVELYKATGYINQFVFCCCCLPRYQYGELFVRNTSTALLHWSS